MAEISYNRLLRLIAADMNKSTTKSIDADINAFIKRLYKELSRENVINVNRLGSFYPTLMGNTVNARLGFKLKPSTAAIELLNNEITSEADKRRIASGNILPFEREILGLERLKIDHRVPTVDAFYNRVEEFKQKGNIDDETNDGEEDDN